METKNWFGKLIEELKNEGGNNTKQIYRKSCAFMFDKRNRLDDYIVYK